MIRCSKCVLPLSIEGVSQDENGMCNFCQEHENDSRPHTVSPSGTHSMERLKRKIMTKRKNRYDCLVPLSGGKDSVYVLYLATRVLGLRPLAFNFDNGFRNPTAVKNMESAVDATKTDLVTYRIDNTLMNHLFRVFLSTAGEMCSPCNLTIWNIARDFAFKYGIKYILTGNSSRMGASIRGMSHSKYCDQMYFTNVIKGKIDREDLGNLCGPSYFTRGLLRLLGIWPITVDVFDYMDIDVNEINATIAEHMNWVKPGDEAEHGDCMIAGLKDYIMYRQYGCSEVTGFYCKMIRNQQITRNEALQKIETEEASKEPPILSAFLDRIKMSHEQFEQAIKLDFKRIPNFRNSTFFVFAKTLVNTLTFRT